MKKSLSPFLTLFISFLIISCFSSTKETINELESISINLQDAKSGRFDSIFTVEDLISLKDSEGNPITKIKRILSLEKNYWILSSEKILHLDSNGEILNQLSNQGQGPGEYQSVDDIRWNENSNLLEVLDKNSGKLLRFTVEGTFHDEWKNPFLYLATSFIPQGDDYYIYGGVFFNGDGNRAVLVSGKTGEKINGYSKIGKERNYLSVLNNDTFYNTGDKTEFFYSDSDTLFTLGESGARAKYFFDLGEFQTPEEFFDRDFENIMDFRNKAAENDYASVFSIQPTNKNLFLFIIQGSKFYTAIVNRSSHEVKITKGWSSEFGDDFSNLSSYLAYTPIGSDSEFLFFSVDPYAIKSEIDKLKGNPSLPDFLKANSLIDRIYQNFETYENPYILKVRIKEF
jgi:hypothetical protein